MTTGIYCLKFEGTDQVYIGQSVNIERRYLQHINTLKKGIASSKLQKAFIDYGIPIIVPLIICNNINLNLYESLAIEAFNSFDKGFNASTGTYGKNIKYTSGFEHKNTKYSRNQILKVFSYLLNPKFKTTAIETITGVPIPTIRAISRGTQYKEWLIDTFGIDKYNLMKHSNNVRRSNINLSW